MNLLKDADGRHGQLTEGEVAALKAAANHGVLRAYYALDLHYSMDVDDPEQEQLWFARGVAAGEPNLSDALAGREAAEAADQKNQEAKRKLLLSAKRHLEVALEHSSGLVGATRETVHEELLHVQRRLAGPDDVSPTKSEVFTLPPSMRARRSDHLHRL